VLGSLSLSSSSSSCGSFFSFFWLAVFFFFSGSSSLSSLALGTAMPFLRIGSQGGESSSLFLGAALRMATLFFFFFSGVGSSPSDSALFSLCSLSDEDEEEEEGRQEVRFRAALRAADDWRRDFGTIACQVSSSPCLAFVFGVPLLWLGLAFDVGGLLLPFCDRGRGEATAAGSFPFPFPFSLVGVWLEVGFLRFWANRRNPFCALVDVPFLMPAADYSIVG